MNTHKKYKTYHYWNQHNENMTKKFHPRRLGTWTDVPSGYVPVVPYYTLCPIKNVLLCLLVDFYNFILLETGMNILRIRYKILHLNYVSTLPDKTKRNIKQMTAFCRAFCQPRKLFNVTLLSLFSSLLENSFNNFLAKKCFYIPSFFIKSLSSNINL